jgi:hypothetical protein
MNNEPSLSELSGESTYRAPRSLEVNEVSLNGDADVKEIAPGKFERKGGYFRKRILVGRANRDEKPEEVNLGKTVSVVFLKIRRRLVERADKGEIIRSTSEHNSKTDAVTLFDSRTRQSVRGVAEDLRKVHDGLRTVQVVYALLLGGTGEPELVRLTIKGASLGSEAKAEGVPTFYQYISSFPRDAHMWEYATELSAVVEEGAKTYFAINFQQGEKLNPETLALAEAKLREVAQNCRDVDEARAAKIVQSAKVEIAAPEDGEQPTGSDYPPAEDDIASQIPW